MENKMIKVTNRANGVVGYSLPDLRLHRNFQPGESKNIALDELIQLQYIPGGEYTLKNLLIVNDKSALEEVLNIIAEPEYFYTEADVVNLLKTGTLDELKDCLDFAPKGVIEILKSKAVELEIPDTQKREAISKKTGFNIENAIMVNRIMNAGPQETSEEDKPKTRRTTPAEKGGRRAAAPKYKVTEQK